ncbi:flagellar biosynthesis repressor FlbT [Methylobacterium sp. V23]|uniref:flagellar biosynthesis repressor FlbT n=1 Tax=Methylobacterium sp. V23 TaxID=2044878 RepID=UPI000CDB6309|nr:flagellar biosynthesis repressor FlbT [Methylobacterium sp. V23]POR40365.1 flagellar protein FlbT [Methylobacterium sp. V23]
MALNVDLAPHERIIIANVSVRNGDRRARLIFETEAKFLREKDMLPASEASTACEHLYVLLQMIYFLDLNNDLDQKFVDLSKEIMDAAPSMALFIAEIYKNLTDRKYYLALKEGKKLMKYEEELHSRLSLERA